MKHLILASCCALVAACANWGYNPTYRINEVQAVNLTGDTISDVSWRVNGSGKALNCAQVAKFAMCADRFARRNYPQQGIEVNWTHPDGQRRSESLNLPVPVTYSSAFPLRFVFEIETDGSVKGFYEQDEPSRILMDG